MTRTLTLPSIEQLPDVAAELLRLIEPYSVIALQGYLGAGKTTLVHQLCRLEGVTEDVINSPTFAIVNVYAAEERGRQFYHIDCYRLRDLDEADTIGIVEYVRSGLRCYIEWPEVIAPLLPDDTVVVQIAVQPDGSRLITVDLPE